MMKTFYVDAGLAYLEKGNNPEGGRAFRQGDQREAEEGKPIPQGRASLREENSDAGFQILDTRFRFRLYFFHSI